MSITLTFVGICLFAVRNGYVYEVLLPDALDSDPPETQDPHFHLDQGEARDHHAGLLLAIDGSRWEGPRKKITIDGGGSKPIANLVTLPQLASDLRMERSHPHSSVTVIGGVLRTFKSPAGSRSFDFEGQLNVQDQVELTFGGPVRITIDGEAEINIDANSNERIYVYNFDEPTPDEPTLRNGRVVSDRQIVDHDFKWHYLLARPQSSTLRDRFNSQLPAPVSILDEARFKLLSESKSFGCVGGSTCYPSVLHEPA